MLGLVIYWCIAIFEAAGRIMIQYHTKPKFVPIYKVKMTNYRKLHYDEYDCRADA
jgi:hypothetical protein